MFDYMKGLRQIFGTTLEDKEPQAEVEQMYQELKAPLDKIGCQKLLRLLDAMYEVQDQLATENFISGFRLAAGIAAELNAKEPYSFERAEEEKGRKSCVEEGEV